jgi:copper chaperone CopZ
MAAHEERLTLEVEGIVCSGCAMDMETVLRDTAGILEVEVSYAAGTIIVDYDPAEISRESVIAKIKGFNFKTRVLPDS